MRAHALAAICWEDPYRRPRRNHHKMPYRCRRQPELITVPPPAPPNGEGGMIQQIQQARYQGSLASLADPMTRFHMISTASLADARGISIDRAGPQDAIVTSLRVSGIRTAAVKTPVSKNNAFPARRIIVVVARYTRPHRSTGDGHSSDIDAPASSAARGRAVPGCCRPHRATSIDVAIRAATGGVRPTAGPCVGTTTLIA